VDEDRDCLLQDAVMSGHTDRFGFVPGVGVVTRRAPRHDMTDDPHFTDGKRLVLFMGSSPRPVDEVELLAR
jgi:hypothetical protein